jgi:hypothetical protein
MDIFQIFCLKSLQNLRGLKDMRNEAVFWDFVSSYYGCAGPMTIDNRDRDCGREFIYGNRRIEDEIP